MPSEQPSQDTRAMMKRLIDLEDDIEEFSRSIEGLIRARSAAFAEMVELRKVLASRLSMPPLPPLVTVPAENLGPSPEPLYMPPLRRESPDKSRTKFYQSEKDVTGLPRLILDVVNENPARRWKSQDFIDAVSERAGKSIQRNTISTFIYRLKKSELLRNDAGYISSVKAPALLVECLNYAYQAEEGKEVVEIDNE